MAHEFKGPEVHGFMEATGAAGRQVRQVRRQVRIDERHGKMAVIISDHDVLRRKQVVTGAP